MSGFVVSLPLVLQPVLVVLPSLPVGVGARRADRALRHPDGIELRHDRAVPIKVIADQEVVAGAALQGVGSETANQDVVVGAAAQIVVQPTLLTRFRSATDSSSAVHGAQRTTTRRDPLGGGSMFRQATKVAAWAAALIVGALSPVQAQDQKGTLVFAVESLGAQHVTIWLVTDQQNFKYYK